MFQTYQVSEAIKRPSENAKASPLSRTFSRFYQNSGSSSFSQKSKSLKTFIDQSQKCLCMTCNHHNSVLYTNKLRSLNQQLSYPQANLPQWQDRYIAECILNSLFEIPHRSYLRVCSFFPSPAWSYIITSTQGERLHSSIPWCSRVLLPVTVDAHQWRCRRNSYNFVVYIYMSFFINNVCAFSTTLLVNTCDQLRQS